jgi:hypothetical protein
MLFLDGVYTGGTNLHPLRFRRVKAPTRDELIKLTHTIASRVARYLEHKDDDLGRRDWIRVDVDRHLGITGVDLGTTDGVQNTVIYRICIRQYGVITESYCNSLRLS